MEIFVQNDNSQPQNDIFHRWSTKRSSGEGQPKASSQDAHKKQKKYEKSE
jgi:hypothetical protein